MTDIIVGDAVSVSYRSGPPWRRHDTLALRPLSFSVAAGETLGVVGESGSGKTTLSRVCLGLVPAASGMVRFEGRELAPGRRPPPGRLAAVMQHPEWALNPRLSVGRSIAEPLAILGQGNRAERRDRVRIALEQVGLAAEFAWRWPHELSGGQRQRVSIARALVTEPRFIVFDEAVSALDVSVQTQILNVIKDLQERHGFAALFISHDIAATRYVSDRIAVLYAGMLMELGPSRRYYGTPHHPYARALAHSIDPARNTAFVLTGGSQAAPATGCPLAPRCPVAIDRCRGETPALVTRGDGSGACHRLDGLPDA
jgi:oligopeptide/dipeptide ABC transporter ATP-binding protein